MRHLGAVAVSTFLERRPVWHLRGRLVEVPRPGSISRLRKHSGGPIRPSLRPSRRSRNRKASRQRLRIPEGGRGDLAALFPCLEIFPDSTRQGKRFAFQLKFIWNAMDGREQTNPTTAPPGNSRLSTGSGRYRGLRVESDRRCPDVDRGGNKKRSCPKDHPSQAAQDLGLGRQRVRRNAMPDYAVRSRYISLFPTIPATTAVIWSTVLAFLTPWRPENSSTYRCRCFGLILW